MADDQSLPQPVPAARQPQPQSAPLAVLAPRRLAPGDIFAYAGKCASLKQYRTVATAAGAVVLRGRDAKIATKLRQSNFDGPLLIDPAVYELSAHDPRAHHASLFDERPGSYWIDVQAEKQVAAYLSPSSFVPEADIGALRRVLTEGRSWCAAAMTYRYHAPAFVVLPVHRSWLTDYADRLAAEITRSAVPVALIPSGQHDPMGTKPAVRGLVRLLRTVPNIALLRTDLAGVGALAHGAVAAAIGTSTTVRHFVPPGRPAGGNLQDRTPRVLVEPLLTWVTGSLLAQYVRDGGMLNCECAVCYGRSLRRFGVEDPAVTAEAMAHSILVWRTVADTVLGAAPQRRAVVWGMRCQYAVDKHHELKARSKVALVDPPPYLRAWTECC